MKSKIAIPLLVLFTLVQIGSTPHPAGAQQMAPEFIFRCADDSYPGQTLSDTTGIWADEINKRSHGRIHVEHFTSATLGNSVTLIQQARLGAVDMVGSTIPNLVGIDSRLAVFTMPFLFDGPAAAHRAASSATTATLLKVLEDKGIKAFDLGTNGFQVLTMRDKPVREPSDLKGLRIRSLPSKLNSSTLSAFGADPTPIVYAQLYVAMQNGTVDGTESSLSAVGAIKLYEVAKYVSLTYHSWLPQIFIMNLNTFKKLPPDLQKVVTDAAHDVAETTWKREDLSEQSLIRDYTAKGMKVNQVPDRAAFRKLLDPVYASMTAQFGSDVVAKLREGR